MGSQDTGGTPEQAWLDFISPFAAAIGSSAEDVTEKLRPVVGDPGPEAIDSLRNEEYTPFTDIQAALSGIPVARLRKAVAENLRARPETDVLPELAPMNNLSLDASLGILPIAPDDASLLAQLKVNPSLKVSQPTVILAIRAALADRCGYFLLPSLLIERMERFAESLDESVGEEFYRLRQLIVQRNYAEIYEGIPGIDGSFVSQKRKDMFLKRLDTLLWPALFSFQSQLKEWGENWQKGMINPAATMALIFGGNRSALPPGMLQPPPTDSLRDSADNVNIEINKVFAGVGVPVAMALGYDALKIKEVLDNPALPAQAGAANRDHLLKLLDIAISPDYSRLEENIVRYTLAVMRYPSVTGDAELGFLTALMMLGGQIPWDKLMTPVPAARRGV